MSEYGFSLTCILPFIDSVIIRKNTAQRIGSRAFHLGETEIQTWRPNRQAYT